MKSLLQFKYIFSVILLFVLSCSEIDRDNILDPKNNDSAREGIILVEAFVNTNSDSLVPDYNFKALAALDSLEMIYGKRFLSVQYHRDTQTYPDPLPDENGLSFQIEDLYEKYTSGSQKGVPDFFINGSVNRVQGASSTHNMIVRMQKFASEIAEQNNYYTIEPDLNRTGTNLSGKVRVAPLGNQRSGEMVLRIVLSYNAGNDGNRSVCQIAQQISFDAISAGEYSEKNLEIENISSRSEHITFILTDKQGQKVLCALEEELP